MKCTVELKEREMKVLMALSGHDDAESCVDYALAILEWVYQEQQRGFTVGSFQTTRDGRCQIDLPSGFVGHHVLRHIDRKIA